jgi:hypothetical protein
MARGVAAKAVAAQIARFPTRRKRREERSELAKKNLPIQKLYRRRGGGL